MSWKVQTFYLGHSLGEGVDIFVTQLHNKVQVGRGVGKCRDFTNRLTFYPNREVQKGHSLGLRSTSNGSKPEPYLTKTDSRNRRASGQAHSPDFCYIDYSAVHYLDPPVCISNEQKCKI